MKTAFLSAGDSAKFKITDTKLHVPIVTLFTVNLTKQLSDEFKKSVYWSNYQTVLERVINKGNNIYELLTFQDVKRLFVLAYVIAQNAPKLVNKVNVKLSDSQLNKLNQRGVNLKMNIKMFEGNNSLDELLLKTKQKNKLKNLSYI